MEQEENEDKLIEQVKQCALTSWLDTYPAIWALEVEELRPDQQKRRWGVLLEVPLPEEEVSLSGNTQQFWTGVRLTSTGQLRIEKAGEYTQGTLDQFYQRLREGRYQQLLQEREAERKQAGETDWQEGEIPF
jgi:hypothetical protein